MGLSLQTLYKFFSAITSEPSYLSQIYRRTTLTFQTIQRLVKILEKKGFVKTKKLSRERIVELTEDGEILKEFLLRFGEDNEN